MKWILPLYIGEKAEKKKQKIIRGIETGKFLLGTYVIMLPTAPGNQLDLIEAAELKQPYYKEKDIVIVGIASGKSEAVQVVADIVSEAVKETGEADILAYLKYRQKRLKECQ